MVILFGNGHSRLSEILSQSLSCVVSRAVFGAKRFDVKSVSPVTRVHERDLRIGAEEYETPPALPFRIYLLFVCKLTSICVCYLFICDTVILSLCL